jgi:hypothetical protein
LPWCSRSEEIERAEGARLGGKKQGENERKRTDGEVRLVEEKKEMRGSTMTGTEMSGKAAENF